LKDRGGREGQREGGRETERQKDTERERRKGGLEKLVPAQVTVKHCLDKLKIRIPF
jgi:hypothetical protein